MGYQSRFVWIRLRLVLLVGVAAYVPGKRTWLYHRVPLRSWGRPQSQLPSLLLLYQLCGPRTCLVECPGDYADIGRADGPVSKTQSAIWVESHHLTFTGAIIEQEGSYFRTFVAGSAVLLAACVAYRALLGEIRPLNWDTNSRLAGERVVAVIFVDRHGHTILLA